MKTCCTPRLLVTHLMNGDDHELSLALDENCYCDPAAETALN
jgi:hypothetical protein